MTEIYSTRTPLSVRTRFEIFKRDGFRCAYCGRNSADVVLEVDHIVPVVEGGTNDPLNLVTACWDCNHGKAGVSLGQAMTAVDPVEAATAIAAQEAAIREYNEAVLARGARLSADRERVYSEFLDLTGWTCMRPDDFNWLMAVVEETPVEVVIEKMYAAFNSSAPKRAWVPYIKACLRRWREAGH